MSWNGEPTYLGKRVPPVRQRTLSILKIKYIFSYLVYFILDPVVAMKPPFSFNMQMEEMYKWQGHESVITFPPQA